MIARLDAAVAARDRSLPGLAMLLDPDAFAESLDGVLPIAGIVGARAVYVRYKPATSCLVAYRVLTGGGEHDVYARAHAPGAHDKLAKARTRADRASPLGPGGFVLDDEAIAVHAFPHDRRLRELPGLVRKGARSRTLRSALPAHPELWKVKATTLRYKAERRWVAKLRGADDARAVLKVHTAGRFRQAAAAAAALAGEHGRLPRGAGGATDLPVARVLGVAPRARALVLEWCPGTPLNVMLADDPDQAIAVAGEAGAALAALHRAHAPRLAARDRHELLRRLGAATEAIGWVLPELAGRTIALCRSLAERAEAPVELVPTHADFSVDQVVAHQGTARLLDLDSATRDEPTADLGSFAADLQARALRGELDRDAAAAIDAAMLAGYRAAGGPGTTEGPELTRRTAASLLLRAPEPFRTRDPEWGEHTEALLARAEELAAVARPDVRVGAR